MNSIPHSHQPITKLSDSLGKRLQDLNKDFEHRVLLKCQLRGHKEVRQSHLSLLSNFGTGAIRLTELADRAAITQQAMGKLIKDMEQHGYVTRHVDDSDKRAKIIELTERGIALINDNISSINEVIEEYQNCLGEQSLLDLERVLQQSVIALKIKHWHPAPPAMDKENTPAEPCI